MCQIFVTIGLLAVVWSMRRDSHIDLLAMQRLVNLSGGELGDRRAEQRLS